MVPNRTGLIAVRIVGLAAQVRRRLDPIWPAWRYRLFAVAWLAAFLLTCNVYLLATVMPAAVRSLSSKVGAVETALVLSPLVTAALLPASRRLELLRGRRRVMSWSLVVYGGGLIVAAASVSATMLILGFAAICGLAGAPLVAGAWSAVDDVFGPQRRAIGITLLGTAPVAGTILGPFLGGFIAEESSWRLSFAGELAVVVVIAWLLRVTPETEAAADAKVDWIGSLLPLAGLAGVLVGISLGDDYGWWTATQLLVVDGIQVPTGRMSITPVMICIGVLLLALSVVRRRRLLSPDSSRLVWRSGPFARPRFIAGLLVNLAVGTATAGILYTLLLYYPSALGLDKLQAGLAVVPFGLGAITVNVAVLRLRLGAGNGLVLTHLSYLTLPEATSPDYAEANGINTTVGDLGYSMGIAILGAVFVWVVAQGIITGVEQHAGISLPSGVREQVVARLENDLHTLTPEEQDAFIDAQPPAIRQAIRSSVDGAFRDGMGDTLNAALIGLAVGLGLIAIMPALDRAEKGWISLPPGG